MSGTFLPETELCRKHRQDPMIKEVRLITRLPRRLFQAQIHASKVSLDQTITSLQSRKFTGDCNFNQMGDSKASRKGFVRGITVHSEY
jgi:hypothetical protein